jgi:hypothetical protein
MVDSVFKLFRQSLFSAGTVVVFEIEGDKLGPGKVCLCLGRVDVGL